MEWVKSFEMQEKLKQVISNSIEALTNTQNQLADNNRINKILIDSKYFHEDFMHRTNITEFFDEFKEIKKIKQPVLYWFELKSDVSNHDIRNDFTNYRDPLKKDFKNPKYRYTSAYRKYYSESTRILYVGKVQTGFWGRLVVHLGYAKFKTTAGMQLFHWYNPEKHGDLILNYMIFDEKMKYLITVLEKNIAKEVEPLIGKY